MPRYRKWQDLVLKKHLVYIYLIKKKQKCEWHVGVAHKYSSITNNGKFKMRFCSEPIIFAYNFGHNDFHERFCHQVQSTCQLQCQGLLLLWLIIIVWRFLASSLLERERERGWSHICAIADASLWQVLDLKAAHQIRTTTLYIQTVQ